MGFENLDKLISLAVLRGCRHYPSRMDPPPHDPSRHRFPDDELAILLLSGSQEYDLMAIRCAAQLLRAPGIDPRRLAFLAVKEKVQRPLIHIAKSGVRHDSEGRIFWDEILKQLGSPVVRNEPDLPHWTRFVSMPGYQRGNALSTTSWLTPRT